MTCYRKFVVLCLFVQGICLPRKREIDKDNRIKYEPKTNNGKTQATEHRERRSIRITKRGKGEGYLFDNPQKINPESDLEVILDSFMIEDNEKEHKAVGVRRKPNYGYSHDDSIKIARTGGRKRNFLLDETKLWHDKEIPYEIDTSGYSKEDIAIIEKGIEEFHDLTCLRWTPRDNLSDNQYYVKIVNKERCLSFVGLEAPFLDTSPYQELTLEVPGCIKVGTVVHEMLHAAGAEHEQCRTDRDKYLDVIWSNIKESEFYAFDLANYTTNYHPYDVESVMQYDLLSFSKNGRPSMRLKDWRLEFLPDSVDGLTFYDVMGVTTLYHCNDSCPDMNCQNAGFVDWKCKCYCPKDLGGKTCTETISVGDCGGTIRVGKDKEAFIQTPNYPANYSTGLKCTWLIEGIPDNILRGTIVDMDISNNNLACYHWIEIRYNLLGQSGPRRCGKTHYEVWDASKDEFKNKMIVQFDSFTGSDKPSSKGFKMKFESIGTGCINNPCVFGKCYSPLNTDKYTCTCDNGFTGTKCDTPSVDASIGCTAEVGEYCMFSQNTDDDFDWEYQTEKGVWGESGSGPNNAYEGWVYFYVGDVYQKKEGSKAVMSTTLSFPAVDRCLTFRYFMNGYDKGTLNVYSENSQGDKELVFADCSDHGRNWIEAKVNVPATEGLKMIFEARVGSFIYTLDDEELYYTDVALDDIWLTPGFCDFTDYSNPLDNMNGSSQQCNEPEVCEDKATNCDVYADDMCQEYKGWAKINCRKFCNYCTESESSEVCEDKVADCDEYADDMCQEYSEWAEENCQKFCNLCDETETVTSSFCEDKVADCDEYADDMCQEYSEWAEENCQKFCNLCNGFR